MKKHLFVIFGFAFVILGGYLYQFGVPIKSSDWANFGSFSGLFAGLIAVYGLVYTIYVIKIKEAKGQEQVKSEKNIQSSGFFHDSNPYKRLAQLKAKFCPECDSKEIKPERINGVYSGDLTCLKCGYTNHPMQFKKRT
ncbi:hypothetical protein [Vibrio rotiferianus]|uniref:hypothetical protein n=1 Tax=Vibrio rotiferianus TaxID=190895 RepID=UPI00148DDAF6|nr:hypothetical protein [Vibrio rotiferianus]NOH67061.1 hypothetical protein [Vibrio rotiferianus]